MGHDRKGYIVHREQVEACQITIHRKVTFGLPSRLRISFEALATGPSGNYTAASTEPVRVTGDAAQSPIVRESLDRITRDLIADGWQVVPGAGQHVMMGRLFLPSFQRVVADGDDGMDRG